MDISFTSLGDKRVVVIKTPDRFIIDISEEYRIKLADLVNEGIFNIVFDLSQTEYVDSSGLGAIVSRISLARSNNGDIRLAAPQEFVKSLLEVTNLNQILKIFDNVDEAVTSFSD